MPFIHRDAIADKLHLADCERRFNMADRDDFPSHLADEVLEIARYWLDEAGRIERELHEEP